VPTSVLAGLAARRTIGDGADAGGAPDGEAVETGGTSGDDATRAEDVDTESVTETATNASGNETERIEVFIDQNQTDPVLITDGGNVTVLSEEPVSASADATAVIDPALLAGVAFFCGAIVVLLALWAWYGTPD